VDVESIPPRLLYPAVFISGFIAIGYEIIWFRLVGVLLKDSIYAFTIMLSVYPAAIALGSRDVDRIARVMPCKGPRNCYLGLNGIIALSVAATACAFYYLQGSLAGLGLDQLREAPILPVPPQQWPFLAIGALPLNLLACIGVAGFFIALPAYLMGATFPLLASLAADAARHPARAVSWVYATAVFGNLTGALVTGFVLLPVLGTERTMLSSSSLAVVLHFRVAASAGILRSYFVPARRARGAWHGYFRHRPSTVIRAPCYSDRRKPIFRGRHRRRGVDACQAALRAIDCRRRFNKEEILDRTAGVPINTQRIILR
jgi:spermidine synthase